VIARWWRRTGPWATPTLIVIEVVLVWSGLLRLRTAVLVGALLEVLLLVTAGTRMIAAGRRFRAGRAAGVDLWQSAEDGLAQLVPRRLAHVIVIEPRLWVSLGRWLTGRHDGRRSQSSYRYDSALRPLLWAVIGLVVVEGAVLDIVLALVTCSSTWIWVSVGVHVYAIGGLLGVAASFATRPHVLAADALRVHDGVFAELVIPVSDIIAVRAVRTANFGRSGPKIDKEQKAAMLAHGDATVELILDQTLRPVCTGARVRAVEPSATLSITVDAADEFVRAVDDHVSTRVSQQAS